MRTLLGTLLLIGCLGSCPAHAGMVYGYGTKSCGSWIEDHKDNQSDMAYLDDAWVLGYLSGYNSHGQNVEDISGGADNQGMLAWITSYCASRPLDSVATAAGALVAFQELRTRVRK